MQIVQGHDPFAVRAEDITEMERRILGAQQRISAEPPRAGNVVPLKVA